MDNRDNNKNTKNNKNNKLNKNNKGNNGKFNVFNLLIIGLILTIIVNILISSISNRTMIEIKYNEFLNLVNNKIVKEIQFRYDRILIHLKDNVDQKTINDILNINEENNKELLILEKLEKERLSNIEEILSKRGKNKDIIKQLKTQKVYYTGNLHDSKLIDKLNEIEDLKYSALVINKNPILEFVLSWILPLIFFYIMFSILMGNMSKRIGGNFIKSNVKKYDLQKQTGIKFDNVAGQDEAKESLSEIVDFLHNPEKYKNIGAKQPKGAILVGPPGTGKTLLAKAVAGEANVPFFSLSGSEFVEMYVGVGASRVRDLFKQANNNAPCIIFIDEIDAIGKSRDVKLGSNDEREQTLNQLLSEMDGFDTSKGIMILAATNRPEILDKALLRPGRFDRRIIVEKPDLKGRESILKVHAKEIKFDKNIDFKKIALSTSGAAGADLANMVNEAALHAVRMGRKEVLQEDLMEAVEVIIAGKEKKDRVLSSEEKRLVSFHEVGHALVAALQKNSHPVQKITIVPRTMGALGYTMQVPEEEKFLMTKEELLNQITVLLAGRAAEEIEFNKITTGASNDIERATKIARSMVTQYGMSKKFGMMGLESIESKYLDGRSVATCSEGIGIEIDNEVKNIIEHCYKEAKKILENNMEALTNISEFLIEKETINGDKFMEMVNKFKK